LLITTHTIVFFNNTNRTSLVELDDPLLFAKFASFEERELLLTVDTKWKLNIYDKNKLKHEGAHPSQSRGLLPLASINLLADCKFFDQFNSRIEGANSLLNSPEESR
jgi:hypothetical protein